MTTSRSETPTSGQGGGKTVTWRRATKWTLVAIAAVFVLLVGTRLIAARSFDSGPLPAELHELRSLPVTLPNGRKGNLRTLIRPGVPTVISIWASWCGPCQKEAPALVDLKHRFGTGKLNLLYLNGREPGATRAELESFVRKVGLPSEAYAILDDASLSKLTKDSANLIPRTYVFDREGKFAAMIVGYKPLALNRIEGLVAQ